MRRSPNSRPLARPAWSAVSRRSEEEVSYSSGVLAAMRSTSVVASWQRRTRFDFDQIAGLALIQLAGQPPGLLWWERSDFAQLAARELHFHGVFIGVLKQDPALAVTLESADLVVVAQICKMCLGSADPRWSGVILACTRL